VQRCGRLAGVLIEFGAGLFSNLVIGPRGHKGGAGLVDGVGHHFV